jgi:hypothetical protein
VADKYIPDDLRDTSTPDTDKNFFKIVITDLELLTTYPLQFRWQYEDKTYSDWSAVKNITTLGESVDIPSQPTFDIGFGYLIVTWDGNNSTGSAMANVDRINVYLNNVFYGSIFAKGYAGKLSLALAAGTYSITFKAVSKLGKLSAASAAAVATITYGVEDAYNDLQNKLEASGSVIANAQNQITSINGTGVTVYSSSGTETTGNRVVLNAEGLAGFKSDGKSSFAILTQTKYFDPVTEIMYSTNAAGREEIAAGTGFFNGAIYAQSGKFVGNLTIGGTMKLGIDAGGTGNHGIYITSNNYWYVGGAFKVGGSNQYMQWDTNTLAITGNITASTITGGTILTSTSYPRIRLQDGGGLRDRIFFDVSSTISYNINADSTSMSIVGPSGNSIILYSDIITTNKPISNLITVDLGVSRFRGIDTVASGAGAPTHNTLVSNNTINPYGSIILVYES